MNPMLFPTDLPADAGNAVLAYDDELEARRIGNRLLDFGTTAVDRAHDGFSHVDPMRMISARDAAGFLPGAGMVEGYAQMGTARDRLREGDYLGAAGDYGLGAFNAISDIIPAMAIVPPVKRTWFHGTGADINALDNNRLLYMTDNVDEAGAYARGGHLGGTRGQARVYELDAAEGQVRNIDDVLFEAMDMGDDLDEAIMVAVEQARRDGIPYIEYMHPSAVSGEDHLVRIAVTPADSLSIRGQR